jgi:fibronectin type 3 domain-containing protein
LYVPTNGSAAGGSTPATPATLPAACSRRVDSGPNGVYTGPQVPALSNVSTAQPDYLFRVQQGGYYGHPNASRCEWVLNGGNPTGNVDPAQVAQYPQGTQPDRNWRGPAYEFGLHYSPNGIIEYKSDVLGGALQGKLLVARYSAGDDIIVLTPGGQNLDIVEAQTGITGFTGFTDPLDLTENPANGHLYVTELGASKITLLRPIAGTSGVPNIQLGPGRLIFNDVQGGTASPTQNVTIANTGETPLTVTALSLTGANPAAFELSGTPTLPATVGPGSSLVVGVAFNPTSAGPTGAILRVASNDPDNAQADITLRGLGTLGLEGANEPSLQWILDTYQIPVNVGDPDPTTAALPSTPILGDEVSRQRLVAAGAGPVVFEPLAVFAPQGPAGIALDVGDYTLGDAASKRPRFSVPNASYQSLNPAVTGSLTFDPGTSSFGLYSTAYAFTNRHVFSEDSLNTWDPTVADRHKVRFYPLKTETGSVVPDAYVVASEEIAASFDYQDIVVIVRNVKLAPAPPAAYKVQYSTASNRSSPVDLAGASAVGSIFVFTKPETGVTRVRFFIDNPSMTGTPARTETVAPYDLQGTNTDGTAKPLATTTLSDGEHTITAAVDKSAGGTDVLNATFTVANAGPPDTTPPAVPAGLTATGSASGIALDWNDNADSDLAGYNVYRSATAAGTYTLLNGTGLLTSSIYNDSTAPSGTALFYRVTALDTAPAPNESQPASISATRPPPASAYKVQYSTASNRANPLDLPGSSVGENIYVFTKPETGVTRVRFFLDDPSMIGAPAQTEGTAPYDLRGSNSDGSAKPLNTRQLSNGNHTVTAAVDKTAGGTDVLNATFTVANAADASPPASPTGLTATVSISGIALDWNDNVESDLAGYNVSRSASETGPFTPLNTAGLLTTSTYNDTAASSGVSSFYRVTAVDTAANASAPATVSATRPTYAVQFSTSTNRTNPSSLGGRSVAGNIYIFTKPDTGVLRVRFFLDDPSMTGTPALTDTAAPYDFKGTNANGTAKPLDGNTLGAGEHTITAAVDKSAGGTDVLSARFFPWQLKSAAPLARFESRGVVARGKLYVFGGFTGTGCCVATGRSDVYDPTTNTWTQIADMPEVLSHVGVAADDATIWLVGGYNGPADGPATASVWKYDVTTNTWSRGPSLPEVRGAGAAAIVGRKLYFFGGINRGQPVEADKSDLYVLSLDGGTVWQTLAPMPNGRNHLASAVLDGKIYAIGGQHIFDEVNGNDDDVDVYDPTANQWTQLADLPVPRGHVSAAVLDGHVVSVGGTFPGNVHADEVLQYNVGSNTWTKLYSLPEARKSPVVGVLNGVLISSTGGNPQRTATATTWMANPSAPTVATTLLLLAAPFAVLFALRRRRDRA